MWQSLTLAEQSSMCDGYEATGGRSDSVRNELVAAGYSDEDARETANVLSKNCRPVATTAVVPSTTAPALTPDPGYNYELEAFYRDGFHRWGAEKQMDYCRRLDQIGPDAMSLEMFEGGIPWDNAGAWTIVLVQECALIPR